MKLLLITQPVKKNDLDYPLAGCRLKSQLLKDERLHGKLQIELLILSPELTAEEMYHEISPYQAEMLGFSCYIWNRISFQRLMDRMKEAEPHITCIAGGPDATACPSFYLNESRMDYVISGEGELALGDFLYHWLTNQEIPSFPWLGRLDTLPKERAPLPQLSEMKSPFLTQSAYSSRFTQILWELTRGCPYNCAFCFEARGAQGLRSLTREQIRQEAEWICDQEITEVFVLDPSFNFNKNRAREILEDLISLDPQCHFIFEIRMEKLDMEQIELFSQLNCSLQIGLQSADPAVCRTLNRRLNPSDFAQKARWLVEYQVPFGLDLIYGLPGDDLQGYKNSLNFALKLGPSNLELFPLMLLEGTELWEERHSLGIHQGEEDFSDWMHPSFPEEDMKTAREISHTLVFFYSWSMAADWLPLLAKQRKIEPLCIIEEYKRWVEKRGKKDPSLFLDSLLGETRKDQVLRDYIRLFQAISLLQAEPDKAIILELLLPPWELEGLPDWDDKDWLGPFPDKRQGWSLTFQEDGLCWEPRP